MHTIVVIPTYNEIENLPIIVNKVQSVAPDVHMLIVDDGSPDGTGELADALAQKYPSSVFVLHRSSKNGLGSAYIAGFSYALAHDYDVIVQMDADLSHDPSYLPRLLERIQECDVVVGSRYVRGVNVVNWDLKRLLLSKCASLYVRVVTGMPVADPTGGFKCWRGRTLKQIDLTRVFSNGYLFQVETTYKAFCLGCRIREEPITFYDRSLGRSKLDWHIIVEAVFGVLRLRLQPAWWPTRAHASGEQAAVEVRHCS